jgi:hypothetical protein
MKRTTRDYAKGTSITSGGMWDTYVACRALCPDGKVRSVRIAPTADSFFSVPASVVVKGKRVSGFVTFETLQGWSVESSEDPTAVKFVPVASGKNSAVFAGFPSYYREGEQQALQPE